MYVSPRVFSVFVRVPRYVLVLLVRRGSPPMLSTHRLFRLACIPSWSDPQATRELKTHDFVRFEEPASATL